MPWRTAALTAAAHPQVLLHPFTTQVEIAVLEADVLVDVIGAGIDRERRRVGLAQHLDLALAQLDVACRQVVVDRAVGPFAYHPGDAQHVLAADVDVVVDHALDDAGVVAQVDEGEMLTVLTPASDPSADADGLADVLGSEFAAQVRAHRGGLR